MSDEKKTGALGRTGQGRENQVAGEAYTGKHHQSLALEPPIIRCRVQGNDLIVTRCPVCGRRHTHGAAGKAGPDFGHRIAHCCFRTKDPVREAARRRGYLLVG